MTISHFMAARRLELAHTGMGSTLVFTLLCGVLHCAATHHDAGTKTVTVRRLAQCPAKKNLAIALENVVIANEPAGLQSYRGLLHFHRNTSECVMVRTDVRRCDPIGSADSCEFILKNYDSGNMCNALRNKDEAWRQLFGNADLPEHCPIEAGEYTLNKTLITQDMLTVVPFGNAVWKIQFTGFDRGVNVFCFELEVAVKIVIVRQHRGRKQ